MEKNKGIKLRIEAVASDGNGVGRCDGAVVFVPFTAPGDYIKAKIVKIARSHAFGIVDELIEPAGCRQTNDCPSFTKCGGCAFRHIEYSEELKIKHRFVADALKRIGKLETTVNMATASPAIEAYRNKAQLPVCPEQNRLRAGFYAKRSHRVIPFERGCSLQPDSFLAIAERCCGILADLGVTAYEETTARGLLRHLIIRSGSDGSIMLALVLNGAAFPGEMVFCRSITERFPQIRTIVVNRNLKSTNVILGEESRPLYGDGYLYDSLAGIPLRLSLSSFFQINRAAAELLYSKIKEYAAPSGDETLLDLYCGAGAVGLSLAKYVKKLIGVEAVKAAVLDAEYNARTSGISNACFIAADAKTAAADLAGGDRIDIAVLDPPRKGCDAETLTALGAMAPKRIVMVSCNPATFARDLAALSGYGYRVIEVTPVDMFPRTAHIECVALMER